MQKRKTIFTYTEVPQIIPLEGFDVACDSRLELGYETESIILQLTDIREVELLLLKYMGYKSKDIIQILNLKSSGEYYMIWRRLRRDVEKIVES